MNNLISVVMGIKYNRNELDTLKRSLDSIISQTHTEFELLICERGSTIQAKQLLDNYAANDSRIRIIDGSNTGSFSEQLNICLEQSHGKWIARMDDDDYSYPERLEQQLQFLETNTDIAFVGCNVRLVQDGVDAGRQLFPERPEVKDFLFRMPYIHPSLMFRKHALDAVNGYSTLPRCERCEDYDLLMRLYENGFYGANIQRILFMYTLPKNGITTRSFRDRVNEAKTRWARFKSLGMLPRALPYVIKPLIVFFIPKRLLAKMKKQTALGNGEDSE